MTSQTFQVVADITPMTSSPSPTSVLVQKFAPNSERSEQPVVGMLDMDASCRRFKTETGSASGNYTSAAVFELSSSAPLDLTSPAASSVCSRRTAVGPSSPPDPAPADAPVLASPRGDAVGRRPQILLLNGREMEIIPVGNGQWVSRDDPGPWATTPGSSSSSSPRRSPSSGIIESGCAGCPTTDFNGNTTIGDVITAKWSSLETKPDVGENEDDDGVQAVHGASLQEVPRSCGPVPSSIVENDSNFN